MTTRRLILIRHAKAEQGGTNDKKRRLAVRGGADAVAVGEWLQHAGVTSGVALVSPARRTAQTWALAAEQVTRAPRTVFDERIYAATVDDLLAVIHDASAQVRTLLLVGHNPSVELLAAGLDDGAGDRKAAKAMKAKYPTSGIAVLTTERPWSGLTLGGASLQQFAVPRG
jgi:phosphohistidine phosphatase